MTAKSDQLDRWCADVRGLHKIGERAWVQDDATSVSFPECGLADLSDIEDRSYWFEHRNAIISSVVRRFPPPGSIFDVGGGNGYVSLGLEAAGFSAVVIEPDPAGIETARRRGLATIQATFQDLALSPNSIPAAGLFDVLEHIEDEAGALARLYNAIRPGGRIYIAVPAYGWLWSAEDVYAGHFRRYTAASLTGALLKAGFQPEYQTYFFRVLVPAVFLFRTLPSMLGLRRGGEAKSLREHALPDSLAGNSVSRSLQSELRATKMGQRLAYGSSVLAVARKN